MEPVWRLRRIGILSAVRAGSVIAAVLGFMWGTLWAFVFSFFSSVISTAFDVPVPGASAVVVVIAPFFLSVFAAVAGAVVSFFAALVYNLAAGFFGGIELDLGFEKKSETGSFI
jgi:CHASE2 domain-containing sensor protein